MATATTSPYKLFAIVPSSNLKITTACIRSGQDQMMTCSLKRQRKASIISLKKLTLSQSTCNTLFDNNSSGVWGTVTTTWTVIIAPHQRTVSVHHALFATIGELHTKRRGPTTSNMEFPVTEKSMLNKLYKASHIISIEIV